METPKLVTRFYGNPEFALDVIEDREIAFIHNSKLNDPFDPCFFFETDFGDSYENLLAYVKSNHPGDLAWFYVHVTRESWQTTVKDLHAYMEANQTSTFLFCTCAPLESVAPCQNLYMWGHYASGHRGVALQFDAAALGDAVAKHNAAITGKSFDAANIWFNLEYTDSFPPISAELVFEFLKKEMTTAIARSSEPAKTRLEAHYERMGKIKTSIWRNENEWRLMWRSDETSRHALYCPIPSEAITHIYLGLRVSEDVRGRMLRSCKRIIPNAPVLQAHKKHGALALEFEQL